MIGDERKKLQQAIDAALADTIRAGRLGPTQAEIFKAAQAHCNTLPKPQRRLAYATVRAVVKAVGYDTKNAPYTRTEEQTFDYRLDISRGEVERHLKQLHADGATDISVTLRDGWVEE